MPCFVQNTAEISGSALLIEKSEPKTAVENNTSRYYFRLPDRATCRIVPQLGKDEANFSV
jgi:hypothetical protein